VWRGHSCPRLFAADNQPEFVTILAPCALGRLPLLLQAVTLVAAPDPTSAVASLG
jgi:hypothetical protein